MASSASWGLAPDGAEFRLVNDRDTFVSIVDDRALQRFGIKLEVRPDGTIEGNAFGRKVTGSWTWDNGFFCRDMAWGSWDLDPNCQQVGLSGNLLRFRSDRGTGDFADLRLRSAD